ncbi:hypothetical protein ACFCP7_26840 [Paenibacillus elgii]
MEDAARHKILLGERTKLLLQIQTCEEVIFTLKSMVRQRGKSLHMLTMEDILTLIDSRHRLNYPTLHDVQNP